MPAVALVLLVLQGPLGAWGALRHGRPSGDAADSGRQGPIRDLVWDDGQLSFSQVLSETHRVSEEARAEAEAGTRGLYGFDLLYDWKTLDPSKGVTVFFEKDKHMLLVEEGTDPKKGVTWGYLDDNLGKNGWMELYIEATSSASYTDDVKAYAAGVTEGLLTAARISQFYSNTHQILLHDEAADHALANLKKMFFREVEFVKKNSNFHAGVLSIAPEDYYWAQTRFVLFQVMGIRDGYNFIALGAGVHPISLIDMWSLNNHDIMPELMFAFTPAMVYQRRKYQEAISLLARASPAATRRLRGHRGPVASLVADSLPTATRTLR